MKEKLNFCTLFNSSYLSRGILLYRSLEKQCSDFHLYVFAFDDEAYNYLKEQNYPHLTVVSHAEFEDEDLLRVKPGRSVAEYCWTCSSSTILYTIEKYGLNNCTYIDADMCFYADPRVLIDEMGNDSVLITEHRYTAEYDQSAISGKYCVQFVTFKNTEDGMKVLRWWRNACIEWCFAKVEDGKFGDQKYLDEWTTRFSGVHELQHPGGGMAPWNMQQYSFIRIENKIWAIEKKTGHKFEAVFFHFHGLRIYSDDIVAMTGQTYEMNYSALELLYKPYVEELMKISDEVHGKTANAFNANGAMTPSPEKPYNFLSLLKFYQYDVRQSLRNIDGSKTADRKLHHHYFRIKNFIA